MNTNQTPEYCTQCPNHCPKNDLHCGRGRAYFANLEGGKMPKDFAPHEHFFEEGRRPRRGHGPHDHHREGHGPHHPHPEINENSSLETLLRACGHRLHHGMPGGPHGSQEQILKVLAERGGQEDQRELQEFMRIRPASASELLTKLEEKGLIERSRDDEDRRKVRVSLTDAGRAKAAEPAEALDRVDLFEALSAEEQENLRNLLLKLLNNWNV